MADFETLARKKREIDAAGPLPAALVRNLLDWYEVELTYTSNAIEGNTLTRQETALVLEKGIAIGGKPLKDHLEAVNHRDALRLVYALAEPGAGAVTERTVLDLHAIVLRGLDPAQAGRYRTVPVRLRGSATILPNHAKVPALMAAFGTWLEQAAPTPENAFEAHFRLVSIHPFVDGNGRTARLLMTLLLLRGDWPPAVIRPEDRLAYLTSLERAQTAGDMGPYRDLMCRALDRSLDSVLEMVRALRSPEGP